LNISIANNIIANNNFDLIIKNVSIELRKCKYNDLFKIVLKE
jgi:hypothetical protein